MEHKVYLSYEGEVELIVNADDEEQARDIVLNLVSENQIDEYVKNQPNAKTSVFYSDVRLESDDE